MAYAFGAVLLLLNIVCNTDISIKKGQDEHGAWCRMSKDTHAFGLRAHRVAKERISPHDEARI